MIVETARGAFGVESTGTGPPVVLCHSLAMSGRMWAGSTGRLRERYTVWSVDARGHGESGWDGAPFSVADMADDLVAVLDGLGVDRAHVVGLSMGGSTALTFAARHPARVGGLVLADTTACYGNDRVQHWEKRAVTAETSTREQMVPFQLDRWLTPAFLAARPDIVANLRAVFCSTSPAVHAAACRALGGLDAEAELSTITAPTLVLVGAEDYATPPPMARTIASRIPGATLHELAGLRHMSLVEDPGLWDLVGDHLSAAVDVAAPPTVDA